MNVLFFYFIYMEMYCYQKALFCVCQIKLVLNCLIIFDVPAMLYYGFPNSIICTRFYFSVNIEDQYFLTLLLYVVTLEIVVWPLFV